VIFRIVAALVAALPASARRALGSALALLVGRVLRVRRAHVASAMAASGVSPNEVPAFYRALAESVVDLLAVAGGASIGARAPRLTRAAREALLTARAEGPVLIAASHTGNWELAAFALAEEAEVAVVAKRQGLRSADTFIRALRERHGVVLLPPVRAIDHAVRALRAGEVVVMPIDQAPARAAHGHLGSFLGRPAWLDRAPFTVARRAKATVLVAAVEGPRIHVLRALPPGMPAREAAGQASAALEAHVRAFPSSWLWLHRRWKAVPSSRRLGRGSAPPAPSRLESVVNLDG